MALQVITPIQKRFADIDSLGHVNNIAQQAYFDVGKSEFFQRLWQLADDSTSVVMVSVQTDFMEQILYGDNIEVVTEVEKVGGKSLTLRQQILRDKTLCSSSRAVMVCYDRAKQQSVEVPDAWRAVIG